MRGQDFELKLVDTAGQDEYAIFPAQHSMDMHGTNNCFYLNV